CGAASVLVPEPGWRADAPGVRLAPEGPGVRGRAAARRLPLRSKPLDRPGPAPRLRDTRAALAWLGAVSAFALTSGRLWLVEPTDARYAEVAREMAASGDWLTPRWNGLVHFHKPPLAYWLGAPGLWGLARTHW